MSAETNQLLDDCYDQSLELLREVSSPDGFLASSAFDHYRVVWGRDAAITALGALTTDEDRLIETSVRTLRTLSRSRSTAGQVAAVVRPEQGNWDFGEGGAVDVTAWYVMLADSAVTRTGDMSLAREIWPTVAQAMRWLQAQDVTGTGLLSCAPATDWMDSSLVRSGRTLHLNTLYHWAAKAAYRLAGRVGADPAIDPADIAWRLNLLFWPDPNHEMESLLAGQPMSTVPSPFPHSAIVSSYREAAVIDRRHYVSHVVHSLFDENCDVLANLVAVNAGPAEQEQATRILDVLDEEGAAEPFPTRSWLRPIGADNSPHMRLTADERHIDVRWRNEPWTYHNAAVWPYIGGFHVTALAYWGRETRAEKILRALARANLAGLGGATWQFHEWLNGETGEPAGAARQAWNAGAFVLAWNALHDPRHVDSVFVRGREPRTPEPRLYA